MLYVQFKKKKKTKKKENNFYESLWNANKFSITKPKFRTTQEITVQLPWFNYSGIPLEKNMTYEFLFTPISVFETVGELMGHLDGARF